MPTTLPATSSLYDNTFSRYISQYSNFTALGQYGTATLPKPNNVSVVSNYTYNPATARIATLLTQQVQGSTATTYQNLSHAFDPRGNLSTKTDTLAGLTHSYAYDNLYRLTSVSGAGAFTYTQTYAYDPIGNILCKSDVGSYTYNYGSQPHAVLSAGNITMQYDANGNMTQKAVSGGDTLSFTYNQDNMPVSISKNGVNNYLTYTYDGSGQRIKDRSLHYRSLFRGGIRGEDDLGRRRRRYPPLCRQPEGGLHPHGRLRAILPPRPPGLCVNSHRPGRRHPGEDRILPLRLT